MVAHIKYLALIIGALSSAAVLALATDIAFPRWFLAWLLIGFAHNAGRVSRALENK